jgi:glycosyltransferase involved in cell wall biosynthesis
MSKADLTLIFPTYNELPHLHESIKRIEDFCKTLKAPTQILFVDDGSKDGTRDALREYEKRGHKVIFHEVNQGRGAAVTTGIHATDTAYVGFIDIDMEVDIFSMLPLVEQMRRGGDIVLGMRVYKLRASIMHRYVLSMGYQHVAAKYLGLPRRDSETGFKLFRREAILPVLARVQSKGWFWDTEIVARAHLMGLDIREVPVLFWRRSDKYTSVRLAEDVVTYLKELHRFKTQLSEE